MSYDFTIKAAKRTIVLPLFGTEITFVYGEKEDALKYVQSDMRQSFIDRDGYAGLTITSCEKKTKSGFMPIYIHVKPQIHESVTIGYIAHECLHAIHMIYSALGQQADVNNDEAEAYTLQYLVMNFLKTFEVEKKQE